MSDFRYALAAEAKFHRSWIGDRFARSAGDFLVFLVMELLQGETGEEPSDTSRSAAGRCRGFGPSSNRRAPDGPGLVTEVDRTRAPHLRPYLHVASFPTPRSALVRAMAASMRRATRRRRCGSTKDTALRRDEGTQGVAAERGGAEQFQEQFVTEPARVYPRTGRPVPQLGTSAFARRSCWRRPWYTPTRRRRISPAADSNRCRSPGS